MWASYLSALLKGRTLEVFVRLSKDDQLDYLEQDTLRLILIETILEWQLALV